MRKISFAKILALLLALLVLAGCGSEKPKEKPQLHICSSMNKAFTELIADSFGKQTGTKVIINYLPGGTQQQRFDYLRQHKFDIWLGGTSEEFFMSSTFCRLIRPRNRIRCRQSCAIALVNGLVCI